METPAQFYVTLPSSNDEILFPSNAVTHFKTVLNPIIDFMNDKYEVALAEFHLRGTVYNFETPFRMLKVVTPSTRENFEHFFKHKNKVTYAEMLRKKMQFVLIWWILIMLVYFCRD